jgi:hypothetical protein
MADAHGDASTGQSGSVESEDRMQTIMKVDTSALLGTIMSIEKALSDYQKPGDVPKWGSAMIARLELVERQANKTPRKEPGAPTGAVGTAGGMMQASLADHAKEEKILEKLREETAHTLKSNTVVLESKISTMTLEIDRLQKLLAIRPTTSELQQVVLTIHDMDRKLQDGVRDMQKNVRGQVHGAVAEETANITTSVQSAIDLNSQSVGIIAKKVDGYAVDISSIRKTTEQALETAGNHIKQCQFDVQNSKELVLQLEAQAESEGAKIEQNFSNLKFQDEMLGEKMEELKENLGEKVESVVKAMSEQEKTVNKQVAENGATINSMNAIVEGTKKDIDDFRFTYEVDMKSQLEANDKINATFAEMEEKNAEMSEYVFKLKDLDVLKQLELQTEQQNSLRSTLDENADSLSALNSKVTKVNKLMAKIEEEMQKLPAKVEEAMVKMDGLSQENKEAAETMVETNKKVESILEKQKQIDTLQTEADLMKATIEDMQGKLKQAQATNMSLLEVTGDHETRLEQMTELIDNSDAIVEQKMLKMQAEIMDNVAAKQADVEALVANMQENIEVISMGVDGGGSQTSAGAAAGGVGGTRGGRAGASMRVGGKPGSNPGSNPGSKPGSAPTGEMGGDIEEKHEIIQQSAEFVSDLCVNYEEICVRKSYVNDLPSAMTENIAQTAQELSQYIASSTDFEAVHMALSPNPQGLEYDDTFVSDLRQKRIDQFINAIQQMVFEHNSKPGGVRSDARKAFIQTMKKAIDLCMSKHDQVLVVGNSRFGRIKLPTCIACDRPLVDKVRQDRQLPADSGPQRDFPGFPQFGQQGSMDDSIGSLLGGTLSGSPVPRNKTRGERKVPVKLPRTQQEKVVRPTSSHAAGEANALRAGMKPPRPGNSNQTDAGMSQSQSGML